MQARVQATGVQTTGLQATGVQPHCIEALLAAALRDATRLLPGDLLLYSRIGNAISIYSTARTVRVLLYSCYYRNSCLSSPPPPKLVLTLEAVRRACAVWVGCRL